MRTIDTFIERFPIAGKFEISRGARTEAVVLRVVVRQGEQEGQGECTPYARYGETPESVEAQIQGAAPFIETGADRGLLEEILEPGAARNALDCALWDLEARSLGRSVYELAGLPRLPVQTLLTLGIDSPEELARKARKGAPFGTLKMKLGAPEGLEVDLERVRTVREAAPEARLVVDANEGWSPHQVSDALLRLQALGVAMVEQPVPAGRDQGLGEIAHPIPVCADESFHSLTDLDAVATRYEMINVKLDKTGGLTHALAVVAAARERDLQVMVGCMVSTSLAIAPALLVAQQADVVDLDGPYLLAEDRQPPLELGATGVIASRPALWGA